MGMINYGGKVSIYGSDLNAIQLSSTRKESSCAICKKKIPKGSVVISKDTYIKFCIDCCPELYARVRHAIKDFERVMERNEADLKLNMEKYRSQNIVASI